MGRECLIISRSREVEPFTLESCFISNTERGRLSDSRIERSNGQIYQPVVSGVEGYGEGTKFWMIRTEPEISAMSMCSLVPGARASDGFGAKLSAVDAMVIVIY